jgi:hypothetical protein
MLVRVPTVRPETIRPCLWRLAWRAVAAWPGEGSSPGPGAGITDAGCDRPWRDVQVTVVNGELHRPGERADDHVVVVVRRSDHEVGGVDRALGRASGEGEAGAGGLPRGQHDLVTAGVAVEPGRTPAGRTLWPLADSSTVRWPRISRPAGIPSLITCTIPNQTRTRTTLTLSQQHD